MMLNHRAKVSFQREQREGGYKVKNIMGENGELRVEKAKSRKVENSTKCIRISKHLHRKLKLEAIKRNKNLGELVDEILVNGLS